MRPVSDLSKLNDALISRLRHLRILYNIGADISANRPELIPYSVIELDNLVLGAMRVLLISSVRNARTMSGVRVHSTLKYREEDKIGAFILAIVNNNAFIRMGSPIRIDRKLEPTIRDPRTVQKIFLAAGLTNTPSLQSALALNTTLFTNLATFRNFYAHRNSDTWQKARRKAVDMGIYSANSVDGIMRSLMPGRAIRVYEDWLYDAELFFDQACR